MRFVLWIATAWTVMFFFVAGLDVLYTLRTGQQASRAVTHQIKYDPDTRGLRGSMQRAGRALDQMGYAAFGRAAPLFELFLYGLVAPLLVAAPVADAARRHRWSRSGAVVLLGLAGLGIAAWLSWKGPDPTAVFYALVNVTLRVSEATGMSYYTGSLLYFVFLPLAVGLSYGGVRIWHRARAVAPTDAANKTETGGRRRCSPH
jgi:hypothetical protein